ncbi:cytoplasmic 60S subunit biogenesis factor ZNF622-like [Zophobas morio]|uniref:cytoplasmic 60S subunit biogenesis factor ZNF622-like n=1 Tax=Zophobas morio TaxID=2755281 RepID=UPI003082F6C9
MNCVIIKYACAYYGLRVCCLVIDKPLRIAPLQMQLKKLCKLWPRTLFRAERKNTFVDHLKSSKHKEKEHFLSVNNVNIDEADFQSEVWEDISDFAWSSEICLFCNFKSETMALSIKHMTEKHSFFIPDYDYIIDVEGFINYLGEKIYKNFTCLKCNEKGRTFLSAEAVQKHMRDKGHNTISFEREETLEYSDYYDYRPSYPDYDPDNPEHNMIPQLDSPRIDFETAELVAPDGTRAAHRSLLYYYKRYSLRDGCVVVTTKKSCEVNSFAPPQSRFLRNSQRYKAELDKKWYTRLGSKTNSLQRRYFRPQVIF